MPLYSLQVTIYHGDDERQFKVTHELSLGALEDSMSEIIESNPLATEFVFSVIPHVA